MAAASPVSRSLWRRKGKVRTEVDRHQQRRRRQLRVRRQVRGTAERPRLCVTKSLHHLYAQLVDDESGQTLAAACTVAADVKAQLGLGSTKNLAAAKAVGAAIARRALEKGLRRVVFDRAGHAYHGKVKALAEAAREAGLDF